MGSAHGYTVLFELGNEVYKVHSTPAAKLPQADARLHPGFGDTFLEDIEVQLPVIMIQQVLYPAPRRFLRISADGRLPAVLFEESIAQYSINLTLNLVQHSTSCTLTPKRFIWPANNNLVIGRQLLPFLS